jgi:eukaryotic-like serine/threonine-protein kinase
MNDSLPERNPVEVLAEEFLGRYRRGENPSLSEYTARHPGLASEILEVFHALLIIEGAGPLLASPGPRRMLKPLGEAEVPERMGDFRIVREIGRGGMGVVYEAFQESLGRTVALKVLPGGVFERPTSLERFRRESRSVAALHHSNIVPVFGVGEHEGHHYYAMQLIRGHTLQEVLEDVRRLRGNRSVTPDHAAEPSDSTVTHKKSGAASRLIGGRFDVGLTREDDGPIPSRSIASALEEARSGDAEGPTVTEAVWGGSRYYRQVARVGLQVAEAMAYAHGQGVLHRDIKPSNLLMDEDGTVWVVDFGLAKPDSDDALSATGDVVGTLRYMAPERFDGHSDRRGDIYSLGVTLYELLTLRAAFFASDQARLIREVLNSTPPSPRAVDRRIPRDLETIVLKAMAREPSARYATAQDLAADIRRFLENRTILARRTTPLERSWRWCHRNPAVAALLVSVAALLVFTAASASLAAARYKDQFKRASSAEVLGREKLFVAHVAEARASRYSRRPGQRFASLRALAEAAKVRVTPELRDEAIASLALTDLDEVYRSPHVAEGVLLAFAPNLESYALLGRDGVLTLRRVEGDAVIRRFSSPGPLSGESFTLSFDSDGRRIVVNYPLANADRLTVWELGRDEPILVDETARHTTADLAPHGRWIAIRQVGGIFKLVDLESGRIEYRLDKMADIEDVSFSPDGRTLVVCFQSDTVKAQIRSVPSGQLLREFDAPGGSRAAWHADGKTLAMASWKDRRVYLYDADTGRRTATLPPLMSEGNQVQFQPRGGLLTSMDWDGILQVWRPETGELLLTLPSGGATTFRTDGMGLATTQANRLVIFRVADGREYRTLVGEPGLRDRQYFRASVHPGGRLLAIAMDDCVGLWDIDHDVAVATLQVGQTRSVVFDSTGDLLADHGKRVVRWRVRTDGKDPGTIRVGPPEFLPFSTNGVANGGRGRLLGLTQPGGAAVVDLERPGATVSLGPQFDVRYLAVSPDGRWAATVSHHGVDGIKVWSLPDGRLVKQIPNVGLGTWPFFNSDSRWLMANLNRNESCRLWSVGDWREGPRSEGIGLGFSPDGRLLAVGLMNGVVRLIETGTGRVVANLEVPHAFHASSATFTADGSRLILPSVHGRAAHVWDLRSVRRQLAAMGLDWEWPPLAELPTSAPRDIAPLRVIVDYGGYDFSRDSLPLHEADRVKVALEVNPDNVEGLLQRAWLSVQGGREQAAVDDYTRVLKLSPNDYRALQRRSFVYLQQQRYKDAVADNAAAAEVVPIVERAEAFNDLAWFHVIAPLGVRDHDKALDHARKAVALAPAVAAYRNTLGIALNRLWRDQEATVELEKSLASAPPSQAPFDLFFLATSYHRLGNSVRAKDCYERALCLEKDARLSQREREELQTFRLEAEDLLRQP